MEERRGYGGRVGGNRVHLVREGGGRAGVGGGTVQTTGTSPGSNIL